MAERLLGGLLLVLAACTRPDAIEGRWLSRSEAFVPRTGSLPSDSTVARAVLKPRTSDTLTLAARGNFERRLTGQQAEGRWSRSGDTLWIEYTGGTRDCWLIWRAGADTLIISPLANPSIVRVYVRSP